MAQREDVMRILDFEKDVPYNIQRLCSTMWETGIERKTISSLLKKGILRKTINGRYQFMDHFIPHWIEAIRGYIRINTLSLSARISFCA